MRVLVVGSGGREHALCWALAASPLLTKLWCAPGNPGIAAIAETVPISVLDIPALVAFAHTNAVDLVVPGPEAPLVAGLADALTEAGILCAGPGAAAARIEGEKSFAKEIATAAGIPTARYARFEDADAARAHCRRLGAPLVVKADGLASGKGVVVAGSVAEAEAAVTSFMEEHRLGAAGKIVLIEECLSGPEVSFFALCDGEHAVPLGAATDHKRAHDGDRGPNTGGMGAVAPAPALTPALAEAAFAQIVRPALVELARRGSPFRGILFAGLMLTAEGPKLIEFNARFGDPECQALLPLLASDLLPALLASCEGELGDFDLRFHSGASVAVVLAARGYPEAPETGSRIRELDRAASLPGVQIFHNGTRTVGERLEAAGGRVLTVSARGADLGEARARAYDAARAIDWPGGFYRHDIGGPPLA
ncbi:MAG TPA: phosphoribosylamine--glycine ligase [Acetobacteraceae bacterium]|nr:phosphoribosylamine--glycine ligase [Acetobacteraceae bacterium]